MQVNINYDKVIDGYATRTISEITIEEYNQISLSLMYRLQDLEEKLESYKNSDDGRFKQFISKTEEKIERLQKVKEIVQ